MPRPTASLSPHGPSPKRWLASKARPTPRAARFLPVLLALIALPALSFLDPAGGLFRVVRAEEVVDSMDNPIVRQVVELLREETGQEPDAEAIVDALLRITVGFLNEGQYSQAGPMARTAFDLAERKLGKEHPKTLSSINNLASLHKLQGRYAEAELLFKRVLAISERVLGKEHPDTLLSVHNLAWLYDGQGRYGEATLFYERALATRERALGSEHPDTLDNVASLAALYEEQGRYEKAEPLNQRALAIRKRVLGAEHPDTLQSIHSLAALYTSQGRYGEAELLYKRALAARERVLGAEHPSTLISVNSLATLYYRQGRYENAEPLFKRALVTSEQVLGAEHPDTLISLNNLAMLYGSQGRDGKAESLHEQALATNERVLGKDHSQTLASVNNLATLYYKQGRYGEAEPLLKRVQAASERGLGIEHPDTLANLNNLAVLYHSQSRYEEAESLYERVLAASERVLGEEHPRTLGTQLNLAATYINNRKIPWALAGLRGMEQRLQGFVGSQLGSTLSEKVRRRWLRSKSGFRHEVFTLALAGFVPANLRAEARQLAANVLLRWKRLAGEGEALMARLAQASEDPKARALAARLAKARSGLSRLVNLPQPQYDKAAVDAARARVERLEVELADSSGAYRAHRASRAVDWRQVRAALPTGSALLSLRAFQPFDFKTGEPGEPRWLGMVIPKEPGEGPEIVLKDLGSVAAVAEAFNRLRVTDSKADAKRLYATLFGALDKELARHERLVIAPDGMLDLVAFSRLVLPDGRYWVERQPLHQLRTGRDLARVGWGERSEPQHEAPVSAVAVRSSPQPTALVAFGGVNYNKFPDRAAAPATPAPELSLTLSTAMKKRLRAERDSFSPLPATGPEASAIASWYREFSGQTERAWYYGADASEARLKALPRAAPPRVLHLATHGFFLSEKTDRTERPMTLSGLALAGANRGLAGETGPDGEDGILYAMEARDLNLAGTELVVLSACDTGKGEVDYSEGVYGLTRAFRIAGARNILMTLWPLDDELAAEFMGDFYGNWLSADANDRDAMNRVSTPAEALHQTRLAWIGSEDEKKRDPRHWAPYVLVE